MPLYDADDNIIAMGVQKALARPDVIQIKNRTLDGQYHIQSIGSGATILDVVAHFSKAQKANFDLIKRNCGKIKVTFDGYFYTGIIDENPSWDRLPNSEEPVFVMSFVLLVETEGVV